MFSSSLMFWISSRNRDSSAGQGFVEYLMIIGLVGLGMAAALIAFRGQIANALSVVGGGV